MRSKLLSFLMVLVFNVGTIKADSSEFEKGQLFFKFKQEEVVYSASFLQGKLDSVFPEKVYVQPAFKTRDARLNRIFLLVYDSSLNAELLLDVLRSFKGNEYVEQVPKHNFYFSPNDLLSSQYNLNKIAVEQAWDLTKGDTDIVVAMVDDAVLLNHPDLAPNIWRNTGEIAGNSIDDDGNGYIDDVNGWDAADVDNNPNPVSLANASYHAHGTHCAGIVSAKTDNNLGIASVGFNLRIMPVKIGREVTVPFPPFRYIALRNAYQGVDYAIQNNADVISMSWGRGGAPSLTEQIVFDVAYARNIVCVAAAGNSNTSANSYPAAYNHVISVASSTSTDARSSFSNYGATIDVTAPGSAIYSTVPGTGLYATKSGTSMACPLVSGICGLMLSINPNLTVDELETCLESTCDNIDSQNPNFIGDLGAGRVNAFAALKCLKPINADFTADKYRICPGDSIRFTDMSVKNPTGWRWSFPGGTPATDTTKSPLITYSTAGFFDVTLIATNANGSDTLTRTQLITVQKPTASISGSSTIAKGGNAFIKFDLVGVPLFNVKFTNGRDTHSFSTNQTTYYYPVSPDSTSSYAIVDASDSRCEAAYSGTANVKVNNSHICRDPSFQITIGGVSDDAATSVIELVDSSFLVGGYTSSSGFGKQDILLARLDNESNIIWQKTIGGSENDRLNNLVMDRAGDIIGVGISDSRGYIFKMDTAGAIIWQRKVGSSNYFELYDVQLTLDGKYIALGHQRTTMSNANSQDLYLLKLDTNGTLEWSKKISQSYYQGSKDFSCLSDSSFLITTGYYVGNYDHWIIKIDKNGSAVWGKRGVSSYSETLSSSVQVGDAIYVTDSYRPTSNNLENYVGKFDLNGNLIWGRYFGGTSNDRIRSISKTSDNHLAISVLNESSTYGGQDGMLVLLDTNGFLIQAENMGGTQNEYFNEHFETLDGGTIAAGLTRSFGSGGNDIFIHRVNCAQTQLCNTKSPSLIVTSKSLTYSSQKPVIVTGPSISNISLGIKKSTLTKKSNCKEVPNNSRFCNKLHSAVKISNDSGGFQGVLQISSNFGHRSAKIGDIDRDGVDDIAIASPSQKHGGQEKGSVWILLMQKNGKVKKEIEISQNIGGFTGILGFEEIFGAGLASIGDFNKDGIPDIAIGSRSDDGDRHAGAIWLCYLDTTGKVKSHSKISKLSGNLLSSTLGRYSNFGGSIDTLGDLDQNGVVDIIVGGYTDTEGGTNTGAVWILFMNANGTVKSSKKLGRLNPKLNPILLAGSRFGLGVSNIGDINSDGVSDVAVTSYTDATGGANRGALFIIKLNSDGSILAAKKSTSPDGLGFINKNDYYFGIDIEGLGDINNDGYWDILAGAFFDDDGGIKRGAFVNLSIDSFGEVKLWKKYSTLNMPKSLTFNNSDLFGSSISLLSNRADTLKILVGARWDDDGVTDAGAAYIINLVDSCVSTCDLRSDFSNSYTCPNDTISFIDLSDPGLDGKKVVYWKYLFGDGDSSIGLANPRHIYQSNGSYNVVLEVGSFDSTGACFDTIIKPIEIKTEIATTISIDKDTICLFDTAHIDLKFTCAVEPVSVKWSPSLGLSNDSVFNPLAYPSLSQEYIATITDGKNNVVYDTVLVVVDTFCCRSKALFETNKEQYCIGDTIHTINKSRVKGNAVYNWILTAPVMAQAGLVMQPVVYHTSGLKTIQLRVQDDCGIDTFQKEIYFYNLPKAEAGADTALCFQDTILLGVENTSNKVYFWTPSIEVFDSLAGITLAAPTKPTTYYLTVIDPFTGCRNVDSIRVAEKKIQKIKLGNDTTVCESDTIILGISNVGEYKWNTGENKQYIKANEAGEYILNFSQLNCKSSDTINILHDSIPKFYLGDDIQSCGDTIVLLTPDKFRASYQYQWDNNLTDSVRNVVTSGMFWLQIENGKCVYRDSIDIDMLDFPQSISLGNDTTICENDSIQLGIAYLGNYKWNTGATSQFIHFKGPGDAILTVSKGTCEISDTITISHDLVPVFTLGLDLELCEDTTLELKPNPYIPAYDHQWSDGSSDSVLVISDSGSYALEVINGECRFRGEIRVERVPKPIGFDIGMDTTICIGDTLIINAFQGAKFSYSWQDGTTQASKMITQSDLYSVDVFNQCGKESASRKVDSEDCTCTLYIPTAFTPNDDGLNDIFVPSFCELEMYKLEVFNRWGQKIFESTDINEGWDGVIGGKKTLGTYFWIITAKSQYQQRGEVYYRSGTVNLISYDK